MRKELKGINVEVWICDRGCAQLQKYTEPKGKVLPHFTHLEKLLCTPGNEAFRFCVGQFLDLPAGMSLACASRSLYSIYKTQVSTESLLVTYSSVWNRCCLQQTAHCYKKITRPRRLFGNLEAYKRNHQLAGVCFTQGNEPNTGTNVTWHQISLSPPERTQQRLNRS